MEKTEERLSEPGDRTADIIQTEYLREDVPKKNNEISETCGNIMRSNAYVIRVPGGEEKEERVETYSNI